MVNFQLNRKSKLSLIIIGLMLLSSIALICLSRKNPGEENLINFIKSHYTVTSEDIDRFNKLQEQGITDEYSEYYNKEVEKMKGLLTEKGVMLYTAERVNTAKARGPAKMDIIFEVKNIKPKIMGIQENSLLSYEVTYTLVRKSIKEKEEFEKTIIKRFYMSREGNQWKVNEFNKFDTPM